MLKRIFKVVSCIFLALMTIFIVVNMRDEPLKPEVKKALNWQLPANTYDDNGYLILLGLDAPEDQNAFQTGKKRLEEELVRFQITQSTHKVPPPLAESEGSELLKELETYLCDYLKTENCVDFYLQQNAAQLKSRLSSFAYLDQRYTKIKNSKNYLEVIPPLITNRIAPYSHLVAASEINRINAVLEISSGNVGNGIAIWLKNAQFSRKLLKGTSSLISRMFAVATVQKDMRILSELMTKYPSIAKDHKKVLLAVLPTIAGSEFFMTKAMNNERDLTLQVFNQATSEEMSELPEEKSLWQKYLIKLFYQPNAATNLFYDFRSLCLLLAESDALHLDETKVIVKAKQDELLGIGIEPFYLKNPVAKILVLLSDSLCSVYVERQYDTEGYIRLVALQLEIVSDNASDESKIKQIMAKYPNPYTGQAMEFDPVTKQIRFTGRHKSSANVERSNIYKISLQH